MDKNVKEVNKGSTSFKSAINTLETKGSVKVATGNIFKSVIKALRTSYANLIEDKSVSVNYSDLEITLN